MALIDKLLDYVRYDSQSDDASETCPSSAKQLILGKHLLDELKKVGCEDAFIDEYGYVYGSLKGNDDSFASLGLIAHMDTSPDASGANVKPRVIENYDGKDIELNSHIKTTVERYPNLKKYVGKTIVVTDGNSLLGADDKAGVALILELLDTYHSNPNLKHGLIRVGITPDEEVGRGADHFDVENFKVDYCYTLDGSDIDTIAYENFNAACAQVTFNGISVHPGSARNKMVNALNVAHEFHGSLNAHFRPEHAADDEGFNHLTDCKGDVSFAKLDYILRNFDLQLLKKQKEDFINEQNALNKKYGYEVCRVVLKDQYFNMKEVFKDNKAPIDLFFNACKDLGITPKTEGIRGGTDGATLSFKGLPCPNLGTGGDLYHGPYELWCKDDGEKMLEILLKMVEKLAK